VVVACLLTTLYLSHPLCLFGFQELQVRVADGLWSDKSSQSAGIFDKDVYEVEI
jgi:hypothetical protein